MPNWVRENVKTEHLVNVYPNPADVYVNIELLSNVNISFIEIINIQGSIVKKQKITNEQCSIVVRDLPFGIYMLRMHTDAGFVVEKFVKQ